MAVTGTRTEVRTTVPDVRTRATAIATYRDLLVVGADDRPRWAMTGVQLPTWGCQQIQGVGEPEEICTYGLSPFEANLDLPDGDDCAEFNPFQVRYHLEHQMIRGFTHEELRDYVQSFALLHRSRILAREAMTGGLTTTGDSMISVADTVVGLDTTAVGALATVEDGLAARIGNGEGFVHMTPGMLSVLKGQLEFSDGMVRTVNGHTVVADAGYTGGAPSTGTVTAGTSWIYGSGPVYFKMTPPRFNGLDAEAFILESNTAVIDVLEFGIVAFEACPVVAALVADTVITIGE